MRVSAFVPAEIFLSTNSLIFFCPLWQNKEIYKSTIQKKMIKQYLMSVELKPDKGRPTRSARWEVLLHGRQKGVKQKDFHALQTC